MRRDAQHDIIERKLDISSLLPFYKNYFFVQRSVVSFLLLHGLFISAKSFLVKFGAMGKKTGWWVGSLLGAQAFTRLHRCSPAAKLRLSEASRKFLRTQSLRDRGGEARKLVGIEEEAHILYRHVLKSR